MKVHHTTCEPIRCANVLELFCHASAVLGGEKIRKLQNQLEVEWIYLALSHPAFSNCTYAGLTVSYY